MKKKKFKNLKLNKQSISNFKAQKLTGGSLEACRTLIAGEWDCLDDTAYNTFQASCASKCCPSEYFCNYTRDRPYCGVIV